jgi:hypothetical protein
MKCNDTRHVRYRAPPPALHSPHILSEANGGTSRARNASVDWTNDDDYIGIDQEPIVIVIVIENLRSEFVWKSMKKNQYIERGLRRAGFTGGWLDKPNH